MAVDAIFTTDPSCLYSLGSILCAYGFISGELSYDEEDFGGGNGPWSAPYLGSMRRLKLAEGFKLVFLNMYIPSIASSTAPARTPTIIHVLLLEPEDGAPVDKAGVS